jgi:hypothetical protein
MGGNWQGRVLLIALSVPLGACSSLFGIYFADRQSRAPSASPVSPPVLGPPTATRTTLARQELAEGQIGAAIEMFQQALSAGEERAPAVNGLGVAYARLGRADLAVRYFEEATAIAPADQRYAGNLALLLSSPSTLRRDEPALASAMAAPQAAPTAASAQGVLQRVSTSEFRIVTADPQPAPVRPVGAKLATQARSAASGSLAQANVMRLRPAFQSSALTQRSTIIRAAAPGVGLQRVSRGEVHIASYEPKASPVAPTGAKLDKRFQPLVRISLADVPSRVSAGFIRIVLPEAQRAKTPKL